MVLWWGRDELLEKWSMIDRLLSPWSSLGLWLSKMGNNPSRHHKRGKKKEKEKEKKERKGKEKGKENKKGGIKIHSSTNDTVGVFVQKYVMLGNWCCQEMALLSSRFIQALKLCVSGF